MSFKTKEFNEYEFKENIEIVKTPDLARWFDGEPQWQVKGLTAHELDKANFAYQIFIANNKNENLFPETIKNTVYLVQGTVDPNLDPETAQKLAIVYPIEFSKIVMKIIELTGKGML